MNKPLALSAAASGILLASLVLSAQPASAADTSATAAVAAGSLFISAPESVDLGSIAPGSTGTATLPGVEVTDARAGTAGWAASVAITDFTSSTLSATIPAEDATYAPSTAVTTGTSTVTPTTVTGGASAATQTATGVSGNNTATWGGTLDLAVPDDALAADDYTATITHSVA